VDPLVTIVIPTFNRPDQLPGAVDSELGQTYGNIEVIIHDNGSDLEPRDILSPVSDPRLKVFRNPTNLGVAKNFSLGLAKATGGCVGILGDDEAMTELGNDISSSLFMPNALMEHLSCRRKLRDAGVIRRSMP
jgi:glycosyltransferase involved in cell wall biosynthesis